MFRLGQILHLPEALTFYYAHVGYYITQGLVSASMPILAGSLLTESIICQSMRNGVGSSVAHGVHSFITIHLCPSVRSGLCVDGASLIQLAMP